MMVMVGALRGAQLEFSERLLQHGAQLAIAALRHSVLDKRPKPMPRIMFEAVARICLYGTGLRIEKRSSWGVCRFSFLLY